MSTHPNAMLLLTLTPDDLPMKTWRAILAESNSPEDDEIKISGTGYHHQVLEGDYDDGMQVSGKPGDILFYDLVTYGYGETVEWSVLESQKNALETWAKGICERHHCSYKISIGANYW